MGLRLAASLRKELGTEYTVDVDKMPNDEKDWLTQIAAKIASFSREIILAGHSLGASMLLKYLPENKNHQEITGIFLIAPPFWRGKEDWVQPLKLREGYSEKLPKEVPMFFYHCKDDEVVPSDHFRIYKKHIPWATFREVAAGGHEFNNDLAIVAKDMKQL